MKLVATSLSIAVIVLVSALETPPVFAQTAPFTDPANLRGERPTPRDGRELPIDGGPGADGKANTALGLQQLLRRLNTRASILNIVAHPDDEDGGMLTLYSRGLGARVADLSLTRGEGGQNAMTGDFEDALGLLRTQELLANDRYTGVDQMFGTEVDFGFSKTKEEAFAKWTHERVLYDAVRAIRLYRPLVITATFIGGVTDGHGQHQVSGQIAQEAFLAAADPKVFPDQIAEGILPWQALRVYARVPSQSISDKGLYDYATNQFVPATFTNYVTGEVTTTPPTADVVVHEGTTDPLLTPASANPTDLTPDHPPPTTALSYVQFARIGLGLQKSQIGPNFHVPPAGTFDVPYHLFGSAAGVAAGFSPRKDQPESKGASAPAPMDTEANFFDGIDTSILSLQDVAPGAFPTDLIYDISRAISASTKLLDPAHPDKIAPLLAEALEDDDAIIKAVEGWNGNAIQKANALHELRIKRVQLNDALVIALGLRLIVTPRKAAPVRTAGFEQIPADIVLSTTSSETMFMTELAEPITLQARGPSGSTVKGIPFSHSNPMRIGDALGGSSMWTRPYFSRPNIEQPFYDLDSSESELRNAPQTPATLPFTATVTYRDVPLHLLTETCTGDQPTAVLPPVSLSLDAKAQVAALTQKNFSLRIQLYAAETTGPVTLHLKLPAQWTADETSLAIPAAPNKGPIDLERSFTIAPAPGFATQVLGDPYVVSAEAEISDSIGNHFTYTEGYRPIGYGDLPRTNFYTPATTRIVPVDLTLPTHHNIAYLPGTGDAVPEALASINLTPTILTVADLTPTTLAKYDTVILGVRTYSAHPDLHGAPTQALLDFAGNGGNVVVQYQTSEFAAADAPYPLSLGSNEKVVDETAPVTLLIPGTNGSHEPSSPSSNGYAEAPASGLIAQRTKGVLTPGYALLTTPNRITPADFDNWIEERGHGFLATWDPHYTALTETHDPGQADQRGGLITTRLGRGCWTYVAFALYRQLPEAVPGAYRLFLNLLNP